MNRAKFFAGIRARGSGVFGTSLSQGQVSGIEQLIDVAQAKGLPLRHLAYVLAGVYHETGGVMQPVREGFAKTDAGARRIVAKRAYGKPAGPYGHVYYGRGRIQNTWLANMEKLSKRFGRDFVKNPDLLLDPSIDAEVTIVGHMEGIWTTKKLSDYLDGDKPDYRQARRIVNGMDRAADIAAYALAFEKALRAGEYIGQKPKAAPQPVTVKPEDAIRLPASPTADTEVITVPGPKKDETTVVIIDNPKFEPQPPSVKPPKSKGGIVVLGAFIVSLLSALANYFFGG